MTNDITRTVVSDTEEATVYNVYKNGELIGQDSVMKPVVLPHLQQQQQ